MDQILNHMAESEQINPADKASERVYEPSAVRRVEHAEGLLTRLIEHQTAKIPSDWFLAASIGAMGLSLYFFMQEKRDLSNLLGLWAPTLLTMGVYNKLVKTLRPR